MKASFCRIPWIVLSAFLAACGGGGGGGGGGDSPQSPTGPAGPPAVPPVSYQGASGPAALNSATAGAMAEALYLSFFVPLDLSDEFIAALPPAGQSVDEVQSGPNGGSVHVTGRTNTDGTGWIAGRFSGYRDGDTTVDGLQVAETGQLPSPANGQRQQQRISFGDFRVRAADVDVTYGGSITRTDSVVTQERTVAGTVLIRDNLGGQTFYTQNVDVTRTVASTGDFALSGTARAFDSRHGYLDVESEGPWHFRVNEGFPHHGAAFRGVGLDGRYLRLSPLIPDVASIEYVGSGATQPNFAARVLWPESFEVQTTRQLLGAPVADGGASSSQRPGTTVVLDSRFTTHPQTAFVSSHWTLLFRPPGSVAAVEDGQLTRTQITLDVEGRYVIAVEVDDGVRTDRDVIVLTADANVSTPFTPVYAQLTPDESVSTGGSLALDLSQAQYTSFDEPLAQLMLSGTAPNGFPAFITQTNPRSATLQFGASGVYELVWSQGPSLSGAPVRDLKYVALNSPMPFAPGGAAYLGSGDPGAIASGDLNADGFADLVVTMRDNDGNALMHLLYGNAAGMLEPAVTLPVSQVGSVAIGDVNSDGLADIVMTTGLGIGMLLQGPLGTFGGELSVPGNCFIGSGERDFALADLNGDHRLDVVSQGCFGELNYYLQSATEGLQAPVRVTTGISSQARLAVGDLNGDTLADVVLSDQSFGNAPSIFAVYGVGGALPGAPVPLPYQSAFVHRFASAVALADVNRDGRLDVLTGENPSSTGVNFPRVMTFLQQANGSFAAPIFTSSGPSGTRQIAALDLNRDGAIDVATFGSFQGLNVLYGGPLFGSLIVDPRPSASLVSKYAFPEAVLDLNHDGLLDFAYLTGDGRRVILGVALGWDD